MAVLRIMDSKFGRHRVYASEILRSEGKCPITGEHLYEIRRPNLQMACYALGVLHTWGLFKDYTHVSMTIVQPFLNHVEEYTCTVSELREVEAYLRLKAEETRSNPQFRPSASACQFCPRAGNCEAQDAAVMSAALDGFDDVGEPKVSTPTPATLGDRYALVPMIESWCTAVVERVRAALQAGEPVRRSDGLTYKLIEGRATARTWNDVDQAKARLEQAAGERAYQPRKVISPAMAEGLTKSKRTPKGQPKIPPLIKAEAWQAMQDLISQGQAKPTIVLETDPNPALEPATAGFEDVQDNLFI